MFTKQQSKVLYLMVDRCMGFDEIAAELGVGYSTIKTHVRDIQSIIKTKYKRILPEKQSCPLHMVVAKYYYMNKMKNERKHHG